MSLWRMTANHTHLYPGARLRCLDEPGDARLASGDDVAIEFADGQLAMGTLDAVDASSAVLVMPTHRTRRGAQVAPRTWRVVPAGEPGLLRVQRRLR